MAMKKVDVFVIGSGSAGRKVAETCVKSGLKVAIADNREYGGTCGNRGCIPKKILLAPTETYELAANLTDKGISSEPTLDWKALQRFKRQFTKPIPMATEKELKELGIQLYHQSPKFLDEQTLSVEGKSIKATKIVVATGQIPRKLEFKGAKFLKNSDDFLQLGKLPKNMVFIGGGYIAMEFAHMAARAGSKITIIEHGENILKAFDSDLVSHLRKVSEDLGINFILNSEVTKIEKLKKNLRIRYKQGGKEKTLKTRSIFNTAGRVPAINTLNLEKGNVSYSDKGIQVNEYLQNTGNPNVYACGDVSAHGLPLTPLSGVEGAIVAENILQGNKRKIETPVIPSAVFTLPNLAFVGLSEEEAKSRYKKVTVNYKSVPDWYNAKRINASAYAYKIVINERTKQIVGAHLLSPHAGETINMFAMAISLKMTTEALKGMIFTFPSWANDIKSML
ncbi:NAD(P)/FAD-dependent oxidoreductase [Arenibacter sp. BSSL-BM3]|uniref:NAD(P)/FAD-dependent oxidoreductase n=1 Tax=Arenibacter arenosicollis TaxID=2762274 RepID=A0ABR7QNW8_9FLAO|nr:NAD(P)/FAD-dependent oxidoreductase [Arenibacter arenosicollis]MBC8768871.1 NAD(P)/FAD-dependent oxidoreductase [Arenibacter arenosicollis]